MTTRAELARIIDHTLLAPGATTADVVAFCETGVALGVRALCVSPTRVALTAKHAGGTAVAAVAGFPSGAHEPAVKAEEAVRAVAAGAAEVDVVVNLGWARDGDWADVADELAAVRAAVPAPTVLKVIVEAALIGPDATVEACRVAESVGADFVKTSSGYHPAGGATVEAVRLMAATVGGRLGVKASGGIRTTEQALAMVEAGATRLGLSASAQVLDGLA